MNLSIITPWLGHEELWPDYEEAVSCRLPDDELLIIDNGSVPPLEFATIYSETNLGYATGSNVGLKHATCEAIVFLNNDVQLVRRGWLEEIREALEPGVLVGQIRGGWQTTIGDGRRLSYVDGWLLGAMREDLLALGGFDETLAEPAYFADNILCLEARAQGMTLREVKVGLRHLENVTAGPYTDPRVREAAASNRDRYLARARELLVTA